jgi:hypothetical protein
MVQDSQHVEFLFGELVVGYFEDQLPSSPGQYRYMLFRGAGSCHYVVGGEKHYFIIECTPSLHVLQISG